jgi:hypothetical protein
VGGGRVHKVAGTPRNCSGNMTSCGAKIADRRDVRLDAVKNPISERGPSPKEPVA